jgi:hypothetical protein
MSSASAKAPAPQAAQAVNFSWLSLDRTGISNELPGIFDIAEQQLWQFSEKSNPFSKRPGIVMMPGRRQ